MTNVCRLLILAFVTLGPQAQEPAGTEQIWKDFLTCFRTAALEGNPIQTYMQGHLGARETQTSPGLRKNGSFNQDPSREEWQMPGRVMDEIGIRPGMTVADVGAGDGWFTFYLADRVGASGRVIAEDINIQALEAVRRRCAEQKVSNVSILLGEPADPKLPAGAVDLTLMVNVLSALGNTNTKSFLGNLAKCLKPEGRLVIVDWDPVKLHQTTKQELDPELRQTLQRLQDANFEVVKTLDFLPRQSIWICKRVAQK